MSTKNLTHMQNKMRWIKDCLMRRRASQPERDYSEFLASRTVWQRMGDWRSDHAAAFYKKAGFAYSQRSFPGMVWNLMLTGLLSPKLIRQKIATQKMKQ